MRKAMAEAEVGDDVFGEDPTIRRLEEKTAEILGISQKAIETRLYRARTRLAEILKEI